MSKAKNSPWWHAGIRFSCQGSGKCCVSRGAIGYVYLTLDDRRRLAATLKLATGKFTRQYCEKVDDQWRLKGNHPDCVFLEDKRCAVYEGRPTQCRTWPFWPENMTAKGWSAVAAYCPGVGKGAVISVDHIKAVLAEQRRSTAAL
jgi:uncharacterized protein